MGILGIFLLAVGSRSGRDEFWAEERFDHLPCLDQRLLGDAGGVGTHIGNQSQGSEVAQFESFVQLLGDHHGLGSGEPEFAGRFLLQGACNERRVRLPLLFAAHHVAYLVGNGLQAILERTRRRLIRNERVGDVRCLSSVNSQELRRKSTFSLGKLSSIDQYSFCLKACTASSRSQISRRATDWTLPALRPRKTVRHRIGETW